MATIIAANIINARQVSLAQAQNKYRTYFITLPYYKKYKAEVDAILVLEDCADCIVAE